MESLVIVYYNDTVNEKLNSAHTAHHTRRFKANDSLVTFIKY